MAPNVKTGRVVSHTRAAQQWGKLMPAEPRGAYLSALFVDYDNVYLSLRRRSEEAAARFAQAPALWMEHIVSGRLIRRETDPRARYRRLAINRVYGNPVPRRAGRENDPNSFIFVRHHFIRAGFEVIDCPPLTAQLKNGSDIRMAIDVRDLIEHRTHFDEFILLSGDADFTPVLHRLREYDREIIIYANDHTAQPYTALCDGRIEERDFVDFLLSNALPAPENRQTQCGGDAGSDTERAVGQAVHRVLGYDGESDRIPTEPIQQEPATAGRGRSGNAPVAQQPRSGEGRAEEPTIRALMDDFRQVGAEILDLVVKSLAEAEKPVPIAYLANRAMKELGSEKTVGTNWAGSGGFLNFLSRNLPDHLRLSEAPPHCVYDPARHKVEGGAAEEQGASTPARGAEPGQLPNAASSQKMSELQRSITRIYEASKAPPLPPSEYQLLFSLIAAEVQENGFRPGRTASAVIARAEESGVRLAHQDVTFVLNAVDDVDPWLERARTQEAIARAYRDVVLNRCRKNGVELSDDECQLVDVWFGAGQAVGGATEDDSARSRGSHGPGRVDIPLPPDFEDPAAERTSPGRALRNVGGGMKRGG